LAAVFLRRSLEWRIWRDFSDSASRWAAGAYKRAHDGVDLAHLTSKKPEKAGFSSIAIIGKNRR
jgi:hypothetical protein